MSLSREQIKQALIDPASIFPSPEAVLENGDLPDTQKIEILRRWEYDARETQVAEEEGFPAREPSGLLDSIIAALHSLGAGPDLEHTPPTKQGGV